MSTVKDSWNEHAGTMSMFLVYKYLVGNVKRNDGDGGEIIKVGFDREMFMLMFVTL
jgi:hypothetical protein